ncbi:MAG TPA: hypothetical protein VG815_19300, partial [Chloroflexota bacterium]|nr:hypothetical protein [Chloroflexota bacterium]
ACGLLHRAGASGRTSGCPRRGELNRMFNAKLHGHAIRRLAFPKAGATHAFFRQRGRFPTLSADVQEQYSPVCIDVDRVEARDAIRDC